MQINSTNIQHNDIKSKSITNHSNRNGSSSSGNKSSNRNTKEPTVPLKNNIRYANTSTTSKYKYQQQEQHQSLSLQKSYSFKRKRETTECDSGCLDSYNSPPSADPATSPSPPSADPATSPSPTSVNPATSPSLTHRLCSRITSSIQIPGVASASFAEQMSHHRCGVSPEAWSTNSDSPTPTNSVADRPWVKETLWHGLLGDEHRQLLGTEEESSDRHSSDDENETDLETVYQITPEQREYYFKQFKAVQLDQSGLLSGQVARVFFEKSRIPVDELRHIWQLCDVTRDGALSLSEFIAAMHLVVLRRNNIPLPASLPVCLQPNVLQHTVMSCTQSAPQADPPEADLLHLDDDEEEENTDNTIVGAKTSVNSAIGTSVVSNAVGNSCGRVHAENNVMHLSSLSTSSQTIVSSRQGTHPIASNSKPLTSPTIPTLPNFKHHYHCASNKSLTPPTVPTLPSLQNQRMSNSPKTAEDVQANHWTKFNESPTSNLSSPGPKPVNFDMQRTAQAVVSDPQILHPVPLRVTPVAISSEKQTSETDVRESSPKLAVTNNYASGQSSSQAHRDSLQNKDLRPIQRPQAKKFPIKNKGAIPPPPQRESFGGNTSNTNSDIDVRGDVSSGCIFNLPVSMVVNKKDPPPLPPPRPHRHGRSSSLDLNKFKIGISSGPQSEKIAQTSFDLQTSTGFADFTHFPDEGIVSSKTDHQPQQTHCLTGRNSNTTSASQVSSDILSQSNQRVSAFEVYRKPTISRNSKSPTHLSASHAISGASSNDQQPTPFGSIAATAMKMSSSIPTSEQYEKTVNVLSETLRHVSFEQKHNNLHEVLQQLREQNKLLLCLCKNLSDELLTVQIRKEEIRQKLEGNLSTGNDLSYMPNISNSTIARAGSSISAPVTANITGGSGSSGIHSNV